MSNDTMTYQKSQSVHKKHQPSIHILYTLWISLDCPGIRTLQAALCQITFGLLRHHGDPRIVPRSTYTLPLSIRASMDSIDTMEIPGLSQDPHTPCHPLSEHLWTNQTLWRSWDCRRPGIHIHQAALCQRIYGLHKYYGDPGIVQRSTYTMQPSVRVSLDPSDTIYGESRIVQGSTYTIPPSVRVYMDSIDTMEIPGLSRD